VFGGKHPWALGQPASECWREVWSVLQPLFEGVMRSGEAFWGQDLPFYLERHGYTEETYFDVSYDPVRDESGGVGGVFCIVSETTGRVIGERRLRTLRELAADAVAKSDGEVCARAAAVLGQNAADVPFALFFVLDEGGDVARLAESVGVARESLRVSETVDLSSTTPAAAILGDVVRSGKVVEASPDVFAAALPRTASTERLVALPLWSGTQPAGVLVAGISRHLELGGHYRDFLDLIAGRLSTAIASVRAYAEERRRAEALAELDRAKTAFFSNVSHEFRTPLTLLLGPLEDLLRGGPSAGLPAGDRDRVDVAHRNALRLLKLVNSLLDFSRLEAGRIETVYEATDLAAYTAELASAFRSLVERAGLRFVVDCPPAGAEAFIDRELWEKIVFNLLSNAFKYTLEGEIRVAVRDAGEHLELAVSDTGTGIEAGELPHVFERFHRVHNARARTHEGTGIGLALVDELVKRHGGTIAVESRLERGTTFVVSIPKGSGHLPADRIGARRMAVSTALGPAPYVEEAQRWMIEDVWEAPEPEPPGPDVDARRARVLLADDNADMRDYLGRLLGRHWTVEAAADGAVALAAARARPPDLVLTDVMMPGLNGFELLRALRADPRTATVPVLLLSARAGEESRVEGLDAGADDYLVKPFSARELIARVNAHLELAAARRRFAAERETERAKLEAVLRQMPAGVVIADASGRFLLTNEAAERILGVSVSSETIASFPEDCSFHPDGRPYRREEWPLVRSIRSGEVVTDEEVRFVRGDGAEIRLSVSSTAVYDGDGRVVAGVVLFQDMSERLSLLAREQAARAEADVANHAKDRFLAVLSHELRTPLSSIIGWTRILRNSRIGESERAHAAEVIERNAQRQAHLINDLLDISRITAGKIELDRSPVDLASVTGEAVDSLRADVEAKRLRMTTELDGATGEVLGDPMRLHQVVLNLLTNAVKFTPEAGRIDVRLSRQGEMARLAISDSGEGIDPAILPYIFEPFRQGDGSQTTRVQRGLGLGLTIVRQLVELHGGTVKAESAGKGAGTTFTVELPIVAVRVSPGSTETDAPAVTRPDTGGRRLDGLRVLVLDDQADARELVALVLRGEGADTLVAGSVAEALDILAPGGVDVLVSDLALPGVDGYALISALRAIEREERRPAIVALALTAYAGHEVRDRALGAGFDAYAMKPLDPGDLVELIVRLSRA
jgi:PAS domain S-box-containing protein